NLRLGGRERLGGLAALQSGVFGLGRCRPNQVVESDPARRSAPFQRQTGSFGNRNASAEQIVARDFLRHTPPGKSAKTRKIDSVQKFFAARLQLPSRTLQTRAATNRRRSSIAVKNF